MKLSKRLLAIAKMMQKYSNHGPVADIGSDHGYLPVWLVSNGIVDHADACEIADGPLQACLSTVQLSHMTDKISVKKGDGLEPIRHQDYDMISICGMGGNLICEILERGLDDVHVQTLVLQPNVNEPMVRSWLMMNNWHILDEMMIEDMGHYYEIMVAQKGQQAYDQKTLYFGPVLLQEKNTVFKKKWLWQKTIHEHILETLPNNHEKYPMVMQELEWINEVLYEH